MDYFSTSKIKPDFFSEILVPIYQTTWKPIVEDHGHKSFVSVSLAQTHTSVGTEQRYKTTCKNRRPGINWPMYHSNIVLHNYINLTTLDQCSPTFSTWRNPRNNFYILRIPTYENVYRPEELIVASPCHPW
jgi:hypothetical protein